MKHSLEHLRGLVLDVTEPLSAKQLTGAQRQQLLRHAARDCKNILQWLSVKALWAREERTLAFAVYKCQRAFVRLSDCTYGYRSLHPGHRLTPVYLALTAYFDKCLRHIRHHYPHYYNTAYKATDEEQAALRATLEACWEDLAAALEKTGTDERLLKMLHTRVTFFLQSPRTDLVSYRWFLFIGALKDALAQWVSEPHTDPTWELTELLLSLHFDSPLFRGYCIELITARVEALESVRERLDLLCWFRRRLYALEPDAALGQYGEAPAVKQVLDNWLRDEITTLERIYPMYYSGYGSTGGQGSNALKSTTLKTVLSVPQLLFFMRLILEADMFVDENVNQLCKKLSVLFSTRHAETISVSSLMSKVYVPTASAMEAVGDYLMKMFNLVQQYRKKLGLRPQNRKPGREEDE